MSRLSRLYANRSRTRVMQLKESLTLVQRGDRSIAEYLKVVRLTFDELTMIVVQVITAGILHNFHQS